MFKKLSLDFEQLRQANQIRQQEWDPENKIPLMFRTTELGGEVGEALNECKKLDRERMGLPGSRTTLEKAASELADVIICVDLVAMDLGVDLGQAVRDKFNATSEKVGLKTRM